MGLSQFHPIVQDWFDTKFQSPTDAQLLGWTAVANGRHALISAPTGSGKTLAAFLTCIDSLVRQGLDDELPDTTQVVYVSPLKALSNDIKKNLQTPLVEISNLAERKGTPLPEIRAAVRTGDTKASERVKMAKKPPHILITTPESLYILLTSRSGRQGLAGVRTLILDEIHAVADDKRGSHLSLSVERLCTLAQQPVTRIGLSATQRPIEQVARFLVGNDHIDANGNPDCLIVDTGHARHIDLAIPLPERELGPIASHEIWGETLDSIANLVQTHDTTLVFVNTRRLVERVAHQLSDRLGEGAVVAHHGSLSKGTRLAAEDKLKTGQVRVCVATASLELGIDIGVVDLVCQVGSPRSIGVMLQRVGRSGHTVGGTPKGRLFPLTRDELVECVALSRAIKRGNLDKLSIPAWPMDVLAQQIVASCAQEEWAEEDLFQMARRAFPYRELPREKFDQIINVLSQGFTHRQGRRGAFLHRDGVNLRVKGRRWAPIAAMASGGAIPDNADYDVIAEPDETFVGTVNEDFAIESLKGDVFLLGNTAWKICRVENGRVMVEDAHGQPPTVPFWLGEALGRTWELSDEVSELKIGIDQRLDDEDSARHWVVAEAGVDDESVRQLISYIAEGKRVLGVVPSKENVVAERFFDESGGMQLVIHAPFGTKINRAWGLALRKRICRTFDFELQASATDDGLNFSLSPGLSMPVAEVFTYLNPNNIEEALTQAVLQAPVFGTRWRWNATRALAILRYTGGRKVPPPLVRMRSDDLLAAAFPAQVACQDNAGSVDIEVPDHPLVFETVRDCLTEAMDLEGCRYVLAEIAGGGIQIHGRDTVQPSVFSHQILNAMPYAFLDDAPLEERRARAVSMRRALPEDSRDLAKLDGSAIARESVNAWPRGRDADELHDALLILGLLTDVLTSRFRQDKSELAAWLQELSRAGRAFRVELPSSRSAWTSAERLACVRLVYPEADIQPTPPESLVTTASSREEAVLSLVRSWVECLGPFTALDLASDLCLPVSDVSYVLGQMEVEGAILRGSFTPGADTEEFCDRRILARIHSATIDSLRSQAGPVPSATLLRFLLQWQHVDTPSRLSGEGGLMAVIEELQGFEIASAAIEEEILTSRLIDFSTMALDRLCLGGEVVWGRISVRQNWRSFYGKPGHSDRPVFSKSTPITLALRDALDWLLPVEEPDSERLSGASKESLEFLSHRGASFLADIVSATNRMPTDVEEGLWTLAASGWITSDSLEALRHRIRGKKRRRRNADSRPGRTNLQGKRGFSRWSVLGPVDPVEDRTEAVARQLLLRYGVLFPELLARDELAVRWRDLVRVLRRLEARGEIRGGRFVAGFVGEQFALPEAVDLLRSLKDKEPDGRFVVVSACDPLNLVGILTPGSRVAAVLGNRLVFRNGLPIAALEGGSIAALSDVESPILQQARQLLEVPISHSVYLSEQSERATA